MNIVKCAGLMSFDGAYARVIKQEAIIQKEMKNFKGKLSPTTVAQQSVDCSVLDIFLAFKLL